MSDPSPASLPPGIEIRRYNHPQDYSAVFTVWEAAGEGIHISFSDSPEELEKLVTISQGLFFLAVDSGRVIGTVMGGFDGRRGLIYHLAVLPEYQNRHIGSCLLNQVEAALFEHGCRKVYLFIVPENMDRAGFYERLGYDRMNVVPFTKVLGV
jgi:ribosomal protein S18 acetylase RimI-like enzyme